MKMRRVAMTIITIGLLIAIPVFLFSTYQFLSRATAINADIVVDTSQSRGFIPFNWKALSQGGEEVGVRMLGNVVPQLTELGPQQIRLDHIYDIYNVVKRNARGQLTIDWSQLDETVCDIYHAGAKPFFALSYMPPTMSVDGSLISQPKNWLEWSALVQKTIEHYSGQDTVLCGNISGARLGGIFYEVWNEPDHESFGKWSLYGGAKDYKVLYYYSAQGAANARNVQRFLLGGPATTAAYKSWTQKFLRYAHDNTLRVDFISWHHYSKNPEDFQNDVINVNSWLSEDEFSSYRTLPQLITEWGYDSNPNAIADTNVGAAHTVASIINLIDQNLEFAFAFEVKDGLNPSWGILTHSGAKKPRYNALKLLNVLERNRLQVSGEGTFVRGIASSGHNQVNLILNNFDPYNQHQELVPVKFTHLPNGRYHIESVYIQQPAFTSAVFTITNGELQTSVLMEPNTTVAIEVLPEPN